MDGWILVGVPVVVLLVGVAASYNRFVHQRQLIANAWSNVDTELQRRYDLVPNLVETVRGYAAHERATLEEVIAARTRAVSSTGRAGEQAAAENELVGSLRQLLALSERYPELKAVEQFLRLHEELVRTEDRLQAARRFFNGNVRDYNRRVQSVPSNAVAALFGFALEDYFEVEPAVRTTTPSVEL